MEKWQVGPLQCTKGDKHSIMKITKENHKSNDNNTLPHQSSNDKRAADLWIYMTLQLGSDHFINMALGCNMSTPT